MTAAPETRRFHLSLRRILPLLAGCFLFVGASAWMILHASAAPSLAARYIIPVAGWLSILFFGTGAVALTVALLLRKRFPLVEVLPEGLKLHSILKPAKGYFFPWESIEAFSRVRIAGNDLLAVHTRDLAQRYDRSGPIGQIAIDISLSCSDTPLYDQRPRARRSSRRGGTLSRRASCRLPRQKRKGTGILKRRIPSPSGS